MPINISFLANTKDLLRGGADVEKTFSEVASSLDELASDSRRTGNELGRSIKDGAAEAGAATKKLERSFQELADVSQKETRATADDFNATNRAQTSNRKEALKEIKQEAKANAAETFSSFNGSASSFVDGIQGTLGGLVSSLGPVGMAAGIVGAAGIGLINGMIQKADTTSAAFRESVGKMTAELIATGSAGRVSLGYVVNRLKELASEADSGKTSLNDLAKTAKFSGSSFADLAKAYAGNTDGLRDLVRAGDARIKQLNEENVAVLAGDGVRSVAAGNKKREILAQEAYNKLLSEAVTQSIEAEKAQANYIAAGGPAMERSAAAAQKFTEAIQSTLQDAGKAWEDYNDDGVTNLEDYNGHIEKSIAATNAYLVNVKSVAGFVSAEALNYVKSLGVSAAPILAEFVAAPLAMKERTAANWDQLGRTSGAGYTAGLGAAIPETINGPRVRLYVDSQDFDKQMRTLTSAREVEIKVNARVRNGLQMV